MQEEPNEASKLGTPLEQRARKLRGLLSQGSPSKHDTHARAAASSLHSSSRSCFCRVALHMLVRPLTPIASSMR